MASLMEADVAAACRPRRRHDPERGSVTLDGRRTSVERRSMRGTGGAVAAPSDKLFKSSEILGRVAMTKILGGCRNVTKSGDSDAVDQLTRLISSRG